MNLMTSKIQTICFIYFRHRPLRSGSSESEEMNDSLDRLLISNFQRNQFTINYMSKRDLHRLYEALSFLSSPFPFYLYSNRKEKEQIVSKYFLPI